MADEQDKPKKPRWRWFQFSLRTLMLLVVVASLPLAWMGNQARKHQQAMAEARRVIAEIQSGIQSKAPRIGCGVRYGSSLDSRQSPTWLETLFGDPGVPYVWSLLLGDDDMVLLKGMTKLTMLSVFGGWKITDAGLAHLEGLMKLEVLYLRDTRITDVGIVHLKGLTELRDLALRNSQQLTDASLVHLNGLTKLKRLDLRSTPITNSGLVHLKGLTNLEELELGATRVTDEGVKDLQQALPNCTISLTGPSHWD